MLLTLYHFSGSSHPLVFDEFFVRDECFLTLRDELVICLNYVIDDLFFSRDRMIYYIKRRVCPSTALVWTFWFEWPLL